MGLHDPFRMHPGMGGAALIDEMMAQAAELYLKQLRDGELSPRLKAVIDENLRYAKLSDEHLARLRSAVDERLPEIMALPETKELIDKTINSELRRHLQYEVQQVVQRVLRDQVGEAVRTLVEAEFKRRDNLEKARAARRRALPK